MTALRGLGDIVDVSPVFETKPVGIEDQPPFWNAVLELQTVLRPETLQEERLPQIERLMGRTKKGEKFGPRTIDIDLIWVDGVEGKVGSKTLPHPDLLKYAHVSVPMATISPARIHPEAHLSIQEIATEHGGETQFKKRTDFDLLGMRSI